LDVIILDIQLPDMSGLEAARSIKDHPFLKPAGIGRLAGGGMVIRTGDIDCIAPSKNNHLHQIPLSRNRQHSAEKHRRPTIFCKHLIGGFRHREPIVVMVAS
jgi:CheY-like chemotaxis protein